MLAIIIILVLIIIARNKYSFTEEIGVFFLTPYVAYLYLLVFVKSTSLWYCMDVVGICPGQRIQWDLFFFFERIALHWQLWRLRGRPSVHSEWWRRVNDVVHAYTFQIVCTCILCILHRKISTRHTILTITQFIYHLVRFKYENEIQIRTGKSSNNLK